MCGLVIGSVCGRVLYCVRTHYIVFVLGFVLCLVCDTVRSFDSALVCVLVLGFLCLVLVSVLSLILLLALFLRVGLILGFAHGIVLPLL